MGLVKELFVNKLIIICVLLLGACDSSQKTIKMTQQNAANNEIQEKEALEKQYKEAIALSKNELTYDQGLDIIKKLAETGYAKAQLEMGGLFEHDLNGEGADMQKAEYWYLKAAEQNQPDAYNALGNLYYMSATKNKNNEDFKKSFHAYSSAVDLGFIDAIGMLASFYEDGIVVSKDVRKALELLEVGVAKNSVTAMYNLAQVYDENSSLKNEKKAFDLYKQSADLGYEPSIINLANKYFDGQGTTKDTSKAISLLLPLAENGNDYAQFNLSIFYKKVGQDTQGKYWKEQYEHNQSQGQYFNGINTDAVIFE